MHNTEHADSSPILQANGLQRAFRNGEQKLQILRQLDLEIARGETVAIMGSSGSGKSTLLNLLGGLDRPDGGSIKLAGLDMVGMKADQLAALRNRHLGFVYQFHHLLPEFSALENVAMPLIVRGLPLSEALSQARPLLDSVGLSQRADHRPSRLSGGERQRVAVARALVAQPDLVLMDEPTGNLDEETAAQVLDLILSINQAQSVAILLVTHDRQIARKLQTGYRLTDGSLIRESD